MKCERVEGQNLYTLRFNQSWFNIKLFSFWYLWRNVNNVFQTIVLNNLIKLKAIHKFLYNNVASKIYTGGIESILFGIRSLREYINLFRSILIPT